MDFLSNKMLLGRICDFYFHLYILCHLCGSSLCFVEVSGDVWLSKWTDDTTTYINGTVDTTQRYMRLSVYAGIGLMQGIIDDL
jgi:hypothetical protein